MKKLITAVVFMLISTALVAQSNSAVVNQTGDGNTGTVTQTGNTNNATIDQYGTNLAEVNQIGEYNNANVDQGTDANPVNNVPSTYHTKGAWIDQIGSNNDASISSVYDGSMYNSGSGNAGSIFQLGDENIASQMLNSHTSNRPNTSMRVAVEIDQLGVGNIAHQRTRGNFGSYGIQQMWVDQLGNDNFVNQYSNGGMQSTMTVVQEGNNNGNATSADVTSTGLTSPLDLPWGTKMHPANSGGIDASAIANGEFTQYQNGRFSTATIDVLGSDNKTTQAQEFTVWGASGANVATIDIMGDMNAVIQGQMGEYNESYVDIDGSDNVVTTSQEGDYNIADVDIIGMNNIGAIQQTGDSNSGTIYQNGSSNTATIIQQP